MMIHTYTTPGHIGVEEDDWLAQRLWVNSIQTLCEKLTPKASQALLYNASTEYYDLIPDSPVPKGNRLFAWLLQ